MNPGFFYKGESKDVLKRMQEFDREYDERRGKQKIDTENVEKTEQSSGNLVTESQ